MKLGKSVKDGGFPKGRENLVSPIREILLDQICFLQGNYWIKKKVLKDGGYGGKLGFPHLGLPHFKGWGLRGNLRFPFGKTCNNKINDINSSDLFHIYSEPKNDIKIDKLPNISHNSDLDFQKNCV